MWNPVSSKLAVWCSVFGSYIVLCQCTSENQLVATHGWSLVYRFLFVNPRRIPSYYKFNSHSFPLTKSTYRSFFMIKNSPLSAESLTLHQILPPGLATRDLYNQGMATHAFTLKATNHCRISFSFKYWVEPSCNFGDFGDHIDSFYAFNTTCIRQQRLTTT